MTSSLVICNHQKGPRNLKQAWFENLLILEFPCLNQRLTASCFDLTLFAIIVLASILNSIDFFLHYFLPLCYCICNDIKKTIHKATKIQKTRSNYKVIHMFWSALLVFSFSRTFQRNCETNDISMESPNKDSLDSGQNCMGIIMEVAMPI